MKPSVPASPRVPDDAIKGTGTIVGIASGVGGDDAAVAPLSTNLVAAATGLAGSLLDAAEATEAADSVETRREERHDKAGEGDQPVGGKAAAVAVLRSRTPSFDTGNNDEVSEPPAVEKHSAVAVAAAAAAAEPAGGEAEQRNGSGTLFPKPANFEEPGADGLPASSNGHNRAIKDREGGGGSLFLTDGATSLQPRTVSLPTNSGGDSAGQSVQQSQGNEEASTGAEVVDRRESEPPRPPRHRDASIESIERSVHARGAAVEAARLESDGRKAANIGSGQLHSGIEQEDKEVANREEGVRHCDVTRRSDDLSPQPAHGSSEAFPEADASFPVTRVASTAVTATRSRHHDQGGKQDLENTPPSHGHTVDENADDHSSPSGAPRAINARTAAASTTEIHAPLAAGTTSRPTLMSQEETENAMAALIAKLRPPAADFSLPQESTTNSATAALLDNAIADGIAAENEPEGRHFLEAYPGTPATESVVPSRVPEKNAADTNVFPGGAGKGVVAQGSESRASEAAEGVYEDDFDDD